MCGRRCRREVAMPEVIDPAWEYWVPDPEIEEVMGGRSEVDLLGDHHVPAINGYQIARRHPNLVHTHLAPEKPTRPPARKRRPPQTCPRCGETFYPPTRGQVYCSRACFVTPARPCETCKTVFTPKASNRGRFCSRKCWLTSVGGIPYDESRLVPCVNCGGGFVPPPGNPRQKFCCAPCRCSYARRTAPPKLTRRSPEGRVRVSWLEMAVRGDPGWGAERAARIEGLRGLADAGAPLFPPQRRCREDE